MKIIILFVILPLLSCAELSRLSEKEKTDDAAATNPHQDYTRLKGLWSACVQTYGATAKTYKELQINEDQTYVKRAIYFATDAQNCEPGKEIQEDIISGFYEKVDDPYYSGYHVSWHVEDYQIKFHDQAVLFQANGFWSFPQVADRSKILGIDEALCDGLEFKLDGFTSIIGKRCLSGLHGSYSIYNAFSHEERFYLTQADDHLIFTNDTFPSVFISNDDKTAQGSEGFSYPSDSNRLIPAAAATPYQGTSAGVSDLERAKAHLIGTWTICLDKMGSTITLDGTHYVQETTIHTAAGCSVSTRSYQQRLSGTYEIASFETGSAFGQFKSNWHLTTVEMAPLTFTYEAFFNATGAFTGDDPFCTDATFTFGSYTTISGKNCKLDGTNYAAVPLDSLFDSLVVTAEGWMDSNRDATGGESEATRKTEIQWDAVWKRVEP